MYTERYQHWTLLATRRERKRNVLQPNKCTQSLHSLCFVRVFAWVFVCVTNCSSVRSFSSSLALLLSQWIYFIDKSNRYSLCLCLCVDFSLSASNSLFPSHAIHDTSASCSFRPWLSYESCALPQVQMNIFFSFRSIIPIAFSTNSLHPIIRTIYRFLCALPPKIHTQIHLCNVYVLRFTGAGRHKKMERKQVANARKFKNCCFVAMTNSWTKWTEIKK